MPPDRSHRALADHDSRFVELHGIDVHHKVAGEGEQAVVLLHHFFGNVWTWRQVQRLLAPHARVVAFDRPGFGLTERLPRSRWNGRHPYTRATAADLTVALMDHLGLPRAVLVGASAGGTIALEVVRRFPERVAGLVLIAPAITGDVGPPSALRPALRMARPLAPLVIRRRAGELTRARVGRGWFDPSRVTDDDVAAYRRGVQPSGWEFGLFDLVTAEPRPDLRSVLPTIGVPTVVVTGAHDRTISPRWSRRTAAAIPGARFVEIDGAGHTPHEERPQRVAELVRQLLTGVL